MLSGVISKAVQLEILKVPLVVMSITILCNSLISVNKSIIHRRLEFLKYGIVNFVSLFFSSSIAIILAIKGFGFYAIISKVVLNSVFATLISYFFAKVQYRFYIDRKAVKSIVNFGGWLTLSVILRNFVAQIDKLLISKFLSVSSLGAYNRPKEFIDTISSKLNGIFDTALFPILSGIQDQQDSIRNAYHTSFKISNTWKLFVTFSKTLST